MIRRCEIPNKLKTVSVVPIHKKGKPIDCIDSYRPVTIESFLKLYCKLVFNNINAFIANNNIIS